MTQFQLVLLVTGVAFVLGALPFAVWLGWLLARSDVRTVGDGNPGTANAFKAGGLRTGIPVLVLEVSKAGVPVGLASLILDLSSWALVPIAVAPLLGHALSPFLGFKGGKAVAPTFGSWIGLTGFVGPVALAVSMGLFFALRVTDAWTVVGGLVLFGVFLVFLGSAPALLVVWAINLALLAWTHRAEFVGDLGPRGWPRVRRARNR